MAITMEDVFFQPVKEIVKMNIIQYQGPAELYNPQLTKLSTLIRRIFGSSPVYFQDDGWNDANRALPQSRTYGQMFQLGMAMPQVNVEYDLIGMAIWMLKMQR